MLIISEPFTWGLVVGLFLLVMVWRLMRKDITMLRSEKKRLQEENKELQGHLNTQLKINAKGNDQLEADLIELREQNENLRSNLNVAKQKPGRAELRHLQMMESAVSVMREQAPGFAPAWEKAMRDAEAAELAAARCSPPANRHQLFPLRSKPLLLRTADKQRIERARQRSVIAGLS